MITSAGIRTLAKNVRTEKNPRELARILNRNRIVKVGVHPFYSFFYGNRVKFPVYLSNVVQLFQGKEDYENTFFIFENAYGANEKARRTFKIGGSEFILKNPPIYTNRGWILESSGENEPEFIEMNRKSGSAGKLSAALAQSDGVLVFGMRLEHCVRRAVSDIEKMALGAGRIIGGAGRDFFISVNRNFTLAEKDYGKRG
ncbi:MAG: hypothetical protein WCT52_02410 [Candidatus Micrarchaeia archaeon]